MPRIYSLHSRLAGPIITWSGHFSRIAGLGFNAVYIDSFGKAGASGSLFAVDDPRELHEAVRGESDGQADTLIKAALAEAHKCDLAVLTDFIMPHTALESRLYREHPDWFVHNPYEPPVMDDLAEIDWQDDANRSRKIDYFVKLAQAQLNQGFAGFHCNGAHHVPPGIWREFIETVKSTHPKAVFICAALGCALEQVAAMAGCGFDAVLDSSAWWDGRQRWYLGQYETLQTVGRIVTFPEEPHGNRLRTRLGLTDPAAIERTYQARYLRAIGLGQAVMMPMGYEYGCKKPLDAITTSADDWEAETAEPEIDLTDLISKANAQVTANPLLANARSLRRITAPNGRAIGLMRTTTPVPANAQGVVILAMNPEMTKPTGVSTTSLIAATGGRFERFHDITPGSSPLRLDRLETLALNPLEVKLFTAKCGDATIKPVAQAESTARLLELSGNRIAIEKVMPEIDGGRFPAKRMVGDRLTVEADIFVDGHEKLAASFQIKAIDETDWREITMELVDNDRWAGTVTLSRNTRYLYQVCAWCDVFASWCHEVSKKHDAGLDLALELEEGRRLLKRTMVQADGDDRVALNLLFDELVGRREDQGFHLAKLLNAETRDLMRRADLRTDLSTYGKTLEIVVDRTSAAFASWYELFPRSQSDDPERHGTFDDVIAKLPYVKDMGFDVLYFPPIHPIGEKNRKGRNNSLKAMTGDPGSPYAIGSTVGGHKALHPELGGFADFARLVEAADAHGLEIAIDFAIQCSPDHPWIKDHPEWFDWRPDGTLKYAENPPKKYEDISNVSFYREGALPSLWLELRDVVLFWVDHGVKIFRVDNPHTKPFPFWEWMIREVQGQHPDTVFLAEAFTRPKVMSRLAKIGYTQSYSYFTWRNEKAELQDYLTELTTLEAREHMRPNFFVNTPDINPSYLQNSGRAGFQVRAVLASTLSTLWGVYSGFELCEGTPIPGKEDYLDSEKYEIKAWDWDRPGHIRDDIRLLNSIRRDNPALWQFTNLEFHEAWNDQIMVYSKMTETLDNAILIAVNLDPHGAQDCAFEVPLWKFGLGDGSAIQVEDLVSGQRFTWTGKRQQVWLDSAIRPYAIWRLVAPGLPH